MNMIVTLPKIFLSALVHIIIFSLRVWNSFQFEQTLFSAFEYVIANNNRKNQVIISKPTTSPNTYALSQPASEAVQ